MVMTMTAYMSATNTLAADTSTITALSSNIIFSQSGPC